MHLICLALTCPDLIQHAALLGLLVHRMMAVTTFCLSLVFLCQATSRRTTLAVADLICHQPENSACLPVISPVHLYITLTERDRIPPSNKRRLRRHPRDRDHTARSSSAKSKNKSLVRDKRSHATCSTPPTFRYHLPENSYSTLRNSLYNAPRKGSHVSGSKATCNSGDLDCSHVPSYACLSGDPLPHSGITEALPLIS